MSNADHPLRPILDYLLEERGVDFSGCRQDMLARRIAGRLAAAGCKDLGAYLSRLRQNDDELDRLIDAVTINVSRFFRDPLTCELIAELILPSLLREKAAMHDPSLRVWSAGCACGEEPYSLAILIHDLLQERQLEMELHFFATDIDRNALGEAAAALYSPASLENIKYRLLTRYFLAEGAHFRLAPEIKNMVHFSYFDMLDKKHAVPPDSVFGDFDLVLCCNLLIYFDVEYQQRIFAKLYHSLAERGYLVLGEAETPSPHYRQHFGRVFEFSPIYRKR